MRTVVCIVGKLGICNRFWIGERSVYNFYIKKIWLHKCVYLYCVSCFLAWILCKALELQLYCFCSTVFLVTVTPKVMEKKKKCSSSVVNCAFKTNCNKFWQNVTFICISDFSLWMTWSHLITWLYISRTCYWQLSRCG